MEDKPRTSDLTYKELLHPKLEDLKTKLKTIEELEKHLSSKIREIVQDSADLTNEIDHKENESPKKVKLDKNGYLPGKVFIGRVSVLNEMWDTAHLSSFYNICTALFILLITNSALLYISDSKRFVEDLQFLTWTFGGFAGWTTIWILMNLAELLILYPLFRLWSHSRTPSPKLCKLDILFLGIYSLYLGGFLYFPASHLLEIDLPPISSFFVLMEQARLLMKTHAFVRENVPKTLNYKVHQDGDKTEVNERCPEFGKFLYFLFAPTLVYRDEYPRTNKTRWNYVVWNFIQVIATILTTFIAFRRFVAVIFVNVGHEPFTLDYFIIVLSGSILVGSMSMFLGFYGLLHCWLNAFAEMLKFGDRLFYEDWWNCTSFSKYYRTWNIVVHDWLYNYIYRDVYWIFGNRSIPSIITVFLLSAIYHEFIMTLTLRFFYPVLMFMFSSFGIGVSFATRNKTTPVWNIFLWWGLFLGWGMLIVLYSVEWFARKNCPRTLDFPLDIVPRSWTCKVLHIPFFNITD